MNARNLVFTAALLTASFLPALAAATHDVPWYMTHPDERTATLSTCQANPGDLAGKPDCVNAEAAARSVLLAGI